MARWAFGDARSGGLSAYGRAGLASAIGLRTDQLTWPGVCHSADIGVVERPVDLLPKVDGLVTRLSDVGLVTLGADCVPLLAVDANGKVVLAAHVGWRGAADGIADAISAALVDCGADLARCQIWLGPSICADCYPVDGLRRSAVGAALPDSVSATGLDLRRGLAGYFDSRGANVSLIGGCTAESADLHSFRRDQTSQRQTAAVVLL